MPTRSCPACDCPAPRLLDEISTSALVNYFICDACRHVWTTSKQNGSLVHHVTPLTRRQPAASAVSAQSNYRADS